MNHYQKYLEVLVKDNSTLKISAIQDWLEEYENYFKFLIGETSCRKWSKWLEDKSTHIFPCICKLREASCVFIETYYELQKIIDLYYRQEKIAEVLKEFDQIKNNPDLEFEWVEKYAEIADFFNGKLEIKGEDEKLISFEFDEDEFYTAILFEDIVMEIYITDEYQIRSQESDEY